ncbi:hypothetical protein CVU82_02260 [Candidatus Falkowbacteria bacterium HGW-Falkowbacteria-1]|uniref:DUF4012 domain-containing protein n=1 Tax=Candidatus Falkowbacteria bacterium HGW-Falkowbacteria-1 TaxID=2013768 RepID=A0A2N2E9P2_9BACT|nr:MAG: hypothetical protein CVU82_02260 [Candidatus Falkowbacteria bacterium HGW-Falkowbacteria-1]
MNNFSERFEENFANNRRGYSMGIARVFLILIIFVASVLLISSLFLFSKVKKIYLGINSGQKNIEESLVLFKEGNFSGATLSAKKSNDDFSSVLTVVEELESFFITKKISFFSENIEDFKYLAKTAETLSRSAEKSFFIAQEVEDIVAGKKFDSFLEFDEHEKYRILKLLYENSPDINGIKANIDLSLLYLDKAKDNRFLNSYDDKINKLREYLVFSSDFLSNLSSFSAVIPALTGYPESSFYLIILQNNNELRPTGGFIGSYGIMEIKLGDIVRLETNDVYHLDMPASLNKSFSVAPPEPIKKYLGVDRWFLRDSNWSPDFPSSAKNIKWFYEQEMLAAGRSEELVDLSGVMAIIPRLITDLLYITGPIEVEGKQYDKDNFIEALQYEVEMAFREEGESEWNRKNIIGDIVKEIKVKLFNMPSDRWQELLGLFEQNIERKDFLVYLFDDYKRGVSSGFNWSGEIKDSDSDFLMVVDANLAAFKTDRVMEKKISYYLEEKGQVLNAKVSINYKNNGWFDWQTTRYRTYTRVYAPLSSKLLKSSGMSSDNSFVLTEDNISNPKTSFAGFVSIEPGQERVLSFEYELPKNVVQLLKDEKYYLLRLQKQPGNNISEFKAIFKFEKEIKSIEAQGLVEIKNGNEVHWTNNLDKDYDIKIFFN